VDVEGEGGVKIYTSGADTYLDGALYEDQVPQEAQLVFQLGYDRLLYLAGVIQLIIKWIAILYVAGHFVRRSNNQVHSKAASPQQAFDLSSHLAIGHSAILNDKQIKIAGFGCFRPRTRAKQNNLLRRDSSNDLAHDMAIRS
jgi:hypothetical protein